jgi:hypothetical protein
MPEIGMNWGFIIWIAAIVVVALRNEWTTSKMQSTLYDENGDLRLIKGSDCEKCRVACQKAFAEALNNHRNEYNRDRAVTSGEITSLRSKIDEEIKRLHDKIDELPERIIRLLRNGWRPE